MQVLKFGGTSLANAENIQKAIAIVREALKKGPTVMVVSALGGTTDALIEAAKLAASGKELYTLKLRDIELRHLDVVRNLIPVTVQSATLSLVKTRCNELEKILEGVYLLCELSPRALDRIVGFGELVSSLLISACFKSLGVQHQWADARSLIETDSNYGFAGVDFNRSYDKIKAVITNQPDSLWIIPGFIASDKDGIPTTLGRGGSDYSASILAAALNARVLEIWTDVSGMMTADPRIVSHAKVIPRISYKEAMELSHFGAKVIYPPTIQPVMSSSIPVWIKNTFAPEDTGTLIESSVTGNENSVRGLSSIGKIALLSLEGSGMVGIPGISKRLFEALANERINVIFITQSSSEYSICVAVDEADARKSKFAVDGMFVHEIVSGKIEPLQVENNLSMIALVGDRMKNHPGISGKMFSALGRNGVNIRAIAQGSSEKNISTVIGTGDLKKALNVLHEEFFETASKQVNLFLVGLGNVGKRLIGQLVLQKHELEENHRLQIRVTGMANSKKMVFSEKGLDMERWEALLETGAPVERNRFLSFIQESNLRNAIFVDVTANEEVAGIYNELLRKSISVVACNKIACSSSYLKYRELKELANAFNSSFLFETNVGAGLPVIGTLNDLLRSGDRVHRIRAVLSGTLNYVFNEYNGTVHFSEIVKRAQLEGYTEPDPRTDLGGKDVMRKILILAREAGHVMEMKDIGNKTFLPASCNEGDVDNFYMELERHEDHFKKLFTDAETAGRKLRFVAELDGGKASVGLHQIAPAEDMYHLYGKDNIVLFYTDRYKEQPLVVKGAGAGADVTASGIFADIIRAARIGV